MTEPDTAPNGDGIRAALDYLRALRLTTSEPGTIAGILLLEAELRTDLDRTTAAAALWWISICAR